MSGSIGYFLASNIFRFCCESFTLPLFLLSFSKTCAVLSFPVLFFFTIVSKSSFYTISLLFKKVASDLIEPLISKISDTFSFSLSGLEKEELPWKSSSRDKLVISTWDRISSRSRYCLCCFIAISLQVLFSRISDFA